MVRIAICGQDGIRFREVDEEDTLGIAEKAIMIDRSFVLFNAYCILALEVFAQLNSLKPLTKKEIGEYTDMISALKAGIRYLGEEPDAIVEQLRRDFLKKSRKEQFEVVARWLVWD